MDKLQHAPIYGNFRVHYIGNVVNVKFSGKDPSSRTDIMRILDAALKDPENKGKLLTKWHSIDNWIHALSLFNTFLEVKDHNEMTILRIPYRILANFSYIEESTSQLLIFNVGPTKQQRDLTVLSVRDQSTATEVCKALKQRLENLYRICSEKSTITESISDPSSASQQRVALAALPLGSAVDSVTESLKSMENPVQAEQALNMITAPLVDVELQQFAELFQSFKNQHISIRELITFLNQMYGSQRNHLLYQLQHLINAVERPDALRVLKELNITEKR